MFLVFRCWFHVLQAMEEQETGMEESLIPPRQPPELIFRIHNLSNFPLQTPKARGPNIQPCEIGKSRCFQAGKEC